MPPILGNPKTLSMKLGYSTILFAAVIILGICQHPATAAPSPSLETAFEQQLVRIDEVDLLFEAEITICRQNQADGFLKLEFADGSTLLLKPVSAKVHRLNEFADASATIVLLEENIVTAEADDFTVATFSPSDESGLWDWDIKASALSDRILFVAAGIQSSVKKNCKKDDFGQLDASATIAADPQTVFPDDNSAPFDFEAKLEIQGNTKARGFIDASIFGAYPVFFGAIFSDESFFLVGVRNNFGEIISTDDTLTAAVRLDDPNDPDCLIWDLVNGISGEEDPPPPPPPPPPADAATFDAISQFEITLE